jgi:hypothetical protein
MCSTDVVPIESMSSTDVVPMESVPTIDDVPMESVPTTDVVPIESVPTAEVETTTSYSQPKLPARLYFSPTLLQDDEESDLELIQPVLSTINQNQMSNKKTKSFLLNNLFSYRY